MEDLGARLKQAREARGMGLKAIATRTKISVAALEALERNDFTRLPGGIFGRAFVRAYAVEIGLDPETTVTDFQVHLEQSEREAAERSQIRVEITQDDREFLARQQRAVRLLRIVAIVVAVIALGLLAWQARAMWKRFSTKASAETSSATGNVLAMSTTPAALPPAPTGPVATTPSSEMPATVDGFLLEFSLSADCWVVASVDGGQSMSQLMRVGETRRFEAKRDVFLDVGNAAAVQLTINGKPAKPLGGAGVHVQKTITRDNLATFLP